MMVNKFGLPVKGSQVLMVDHRETYLLSFKYNHMNYSIVKGIISLSRCLLHLLKQHEVMKWKYRLVMVKYLSKYQLEHKQVKRSDYVVKVLQTFEDMVKEINA